MCWRVSGESTFSPAAERDAAKRLADLHAATAGAFGFERDTLTGPVRQPNPRTDPWPAFFRDHRVLHAAEGARAAGELPAGLHERVRSAAADFESLLREPPTPALIHAWPFGERHVDELDRTLAGPGY